MSTSQAKKVTVIVPIKNMAGKLSNLESWLGSALQLEIEVILILDGCTDKTDDELRLAGYYSYPNCIPIYTADIGPGMARNLGLQNAEGTWVCFWDSDDVGDVKNLLEGIAILEANNTEVGIGNYRVSLQGFDSMEAQMKYLPAKNSLDSVILNPGIWRMIFHRNLLVNCKFGQSRMGEDQVFLASTLTLSPKIWFFDFSLYTYFKGIPDQLTSFNIDKREILTSISEIESVLSESKIEHRKYLYAMILRLNLTLLKHHPLAFARHSFPRFVTILIKPRYNSIFSFIGALVLVARYLVIGEKN
jgi:glycosyltransferase involved in cell wall biosynthesis